MKLEDTSGLPLLLILQTNTRYMITTNIDVSDGLYNGATGIVKEVFLENDGNSKRSDKNKLDVNENPILVWMKFEDSTIGLTARAVLKHPKNKDYVPI